MLKKVTEQYFCDWCKAETDTSGNRQLRVFSLHGYGLGCGYKDEICAECAYKVEAFRKGLIKEQPHDH